MNGIFLMIVKFKFAIQKKNALINIFLIYFMRANKLKILYLIILLFFFLGESFLKKLTLFFLYNLGYISIFNLFKIN